MGEKSFFVSRKQFSQNSANIFLRKIARISWKNTVFFAKCLLCFAMFHKIIHFRHARKRPLKVPRAENFAHDWLVASDSILNRYSYFLFQEYSLASLIFYCMKEGACSEQSARMSAMDNASKNASTFVFISIIFWAVVVAKWFDRRTQNLEVPSSNPTGTGASFLFYQQQSVLNRVPQKRCFSLRSNNHSCVA